MQSALGEHLNTRYWGLMEMIATIGTITEEITFKIMTSLLK